MFFTEWPIEAELKRYKALHGELPPGTMEDDMLTSTACLHCGAVMPAGTAACAACGWTYKAAGDAETGRPV